MREPAGRLPPPPIEPYQHFRVQDGLAVAVEP